MLASWVACCWLKFPVIWAWPPVMAAMMFGEEMILPSSTTASWANGEVGLPPLPYLSNIVVVRSPKAFAPSPLKLRLTCQSVEVVLSVAEALWTMVPNTVDLSSTYLRSDIQLTTWVFGLSHFVGSLL